jgi:hypothetical protein
MMFRNADTTTGLISGHSECADRRAGRRASIYIPACLAVLISVGTGHANGFGESSPWQFRTANERAVNIGIVDVMERKRGGFYDGFTTTVTNVTNIGAQINCNNVANAIGNEATNAQVGNSVSNDLSGDLSADTTGNSALSDIGSGSGTTGTEQSSSGAQTSSVSDSGVSLAAGSASNGATRNDLLNWQDNSGNQTAGVDSSTACKLAGATVTGNVDGSASGQILNAP